MKIVFYVHNKNIMIGHVFMLRRNDLQYLCYEHSYEKKQFGVYQRTEIEYVVTESLEYPCRTARVACAPTAQVAEAEIVGTAQLTSLL